jgi:hypothetical protein
MALFSDVDWTILLAVGAVLLLGKDGGTVLKQMGRLYGRMNRLKAEILSDFAKAADLPAPVPGQVMSIRQALLSYEPGAPGRATGIPAAVTSPPPVPDALVPIAAAAPMGLGPSTWSVSYPHSSQESERYR